MIHSTVRVPFAAPDPRSGPLTWGQRAIWKVIDWIGDGAAYFNIPLVLDLPPGCDAESVGLALRALVERHGALRSHVLDTDDGLCQRVAGTGEISMEVYDAPAGRAQALAGVIVSRLAADVFDLATQWPLRVSLVNVDDVARHLCLVLSHQMVDGWAVGVLRDELNTLLTVGGNGLDWPARQPLEQAALEAAIAPRKVAATLEHWHSTLAGMPRSMFDFEAAPPDSVGRFVRLAMESRAVAVAASHLARRHGVSTSTVLLAATAAVMCAWTDHDQAGFQLIAGHRLDAGSRGLVAPATCDAVLLLDATTGSFADLLRRTSRAALVAYRFGHYDPFAVDDIRAQAALERGGAVDVQALNFNDLRSVDGWSPAVANAPAEEAARAVDESTVTFEGAWARHNLKAFLTIDDTPRTARLVLTADTVFVPRVAIEMLLRRIEALVVAALTANVDLADLADAVPAVPRGRQWRRIGGGWVDVESTAALVRAASTCSLASTEVLGDRIVARLPVPELARLSSQLHSRVVDAVAGRTDVQAPHEYVVTDVAGTTVVKTVMGTRPC